MSRRRAGVLAACAGALSLVFAGLGLAQQPLVADLSRHLIAITTGFTGTDVLMFGAIEGPGHIVVVVRGPTQEVVVRRQGRVAGIWVNTESMAFNRVPAYYTVAASGPVAELVSPAIQARHEIGLDYLRLGAPDVDPERIQRFRAGLIRNKQRAGLYGTDIGRVNFLGGRLFRTNVFFPANVPTGSYLVEVLLVREGEIVSAQTTPLIVSKIGIGADIYDFAHSRAAAYGAVAILGALMAGWFAHLAFRRI